MSPVTECMIYGSEPPESPHVARGNQIRLMDRARTRLTPALLLSLLIHLLLLSLTFDGQTWVGGLGSLWRVRKNDIPVLNVVLVTPDEAVRYAAAPIAKSPQPTIVDQPAATSTVSTPLASPAPAPGSFAVGIVPESSGTARSPSEPTSSSHPETVVTSTEDAKPAAVPEKRRDIALPKKKSGTATRRSKPAVVAGAPSGNPRVRADRSSETAVPSPPPDVIAVERNDDATWTVPVAPTEPDVAADASPVIASPDTASPSIADAGEPA